MLIMTTNTAWSGTHDHGLRVDVTRDGRLYTFIASFDTPLTKCAAFRYLTDYEAAKQLPGVVESLAYRQSANKVTVERTVDEQILFFRLRLHSVMEYTEKPFNNVAFTQLTGDSKTFQGSWDIESNRKGSTIRFTGLWEPDTVIPLFIVDHFAKNGLVDRFTAVAQMAEGRKDMAPASCAD
jgi:hypothetical protein